MISCEHKWIPGLFLFSFSLSGLILLTVGRAGSALPPCLSVQINKMSKHGVGSAGIFIAVLIIHVECSVSYYKE